jgi:hypothetical protein
MFKYVAIALSIFLLLAGAGAGAYYYYYVYPPVAAKRSTLKLLEKVQLAVASKDKEQIYAMLPVILTPDVNIGLAVSFRYIGLEDGAQVTHYRFVDSGYFTDFIRGVLRSSTDFGMPKVSLDRFELFPERNIAEIEFTSEQWADAQAFFAGEGVNTRYETEVSCDAELSFLESDPRIQKMNCNVQLRHVPKPEDLEKIKNPVGVSPIPMP